MGYIIECKLLIYVRERVGCDDVSTQRTCRAKIRYVRISSLPGWITVGSLKYHSRYTTVVMKERIRRIYKHSHCTGRLEISSTNKSRQFILDARARVSANDDRRAGVSRMLNFLFPFWEGLFSTIKTSLLSPCSLSLFFNPHPHVQHATAARTWLPPCTSTPTPCLIARPSLTGTMDVSVVDVQSSTSLPVATLPTQSHFFQPLLWSPRPTRTWVLSTVCLTS